MLSKHWIDKSEKREIERTEARKKIRDAEASETNFKFDKQQTQITGMGNSFDKHINEHRVKDEKKDTQLDNITKRIQNIEANLITRKEFEDLQLTVHGIDKNMVKIATILEERQKAVAIA